MERHFLHLEDDWDVSAWKRGRILRCGCRDFNNIKKKFVVYWFYCIKEKRSKMDVREMRNEALGKRVVKALESRNMEDIM